MAYSACAAIHLPLMQAYQGGTQATAYCFYECPVSIHVVWANRYVIEYPLPLVASMVEGQVIPCGHWTNQITTGNGRVDTRVSQLYYFLLFNGGSIGSTTVLLTEPASNFDAWAKKYKLPSNGELFLLSKRKRYWRGRGKQDKHGGFNIVADMERRGAKFYLFHHEDEVQAAIKKSPCLCAGGF